MRWRLNDSRNRCRRELSINKLAASSMSESLVIIADNWLADHHSHSLKPHIGCNRTTTTTTTTTEAKTTEVASQFNWIQFHFAVVQINPIFLLFFRPATSNFLAYNGTQQHTKNLRRKGRRGVCRSNELAGSGGTQTYTQVGRPPGDWRLI